MHIPRKGFEMAAAVIDPEECIDCDRALRCARSMRAFAEDQLPEEWQKYIQINADYYKR